jgi:hypothetical protein
MALSGAEPRQQCPSAGVLPPGAVSTTHGARLDRIGINHFGFALTDLKATLAVLDAKGVRQRAEMLEFPDRKLGFLEGA